MSESTRSPEEQAYVEALLRERAGYARYGRADRVADVDAELDRLGVKREDTHDVGDTEQAVPPPAEKAVPRRGRPRRS